MKSILLILACLLQFGHFAHGQSVDSSNNGYDIIRKDTTLTMFGDTAYKLVLNIVESRDAPDARSLLTLYKEKNGKDSILQQDSLECWMFEIGFADYNGDGVKDLLIYHYAGARANEFHYLYLVDKKHKKLIKVKGFEDIPNPEPTADKMIYSYALCGVNYSQLYKITPKFEVVPVGKPKDDIEDDPPAKKKIKRKAVPFKK